MPNHVTNKLTISGDKTAFEYLQRRVAHDSNIFDINSFFPMPERLRDISVPTKILSDDEYQEWEKKKVLGKLGEYDMVVGQPITKSISDKLVKEYGCNNWYDWAINNWGTKWGSYDSSFDSKKKTYTFLTAWDPPIKAIMKLSEMYPTLRMKLKYSDEDFGNYVGEVTFKAGKIVKHFEPEKGIEAYLFAMDINGDEEYLISRLSDIEDGEDLKEPFYQFCIYLAVKRHGFSDKFPSKVLEAIMELYVQEEMYERAGQVKKILDIKNNA